jgi:hypothetical protein
MNPEVIRDTDIRLSHHAARLAAGDFEFKARERNT